MLNSNYLNKKKKNTFLNNKIIDKTLQNTSLDFYNVTTIEEKNKEKNKMNDILIKIKKNNGKLLMAMKKINNGLFSPKQNLNNKINIRKNKIYSKENLNLNLNNKSNDLKSIINSKIIKEVKSKYVNWENL